ncbi:OmpP1/FadL family transporter [Legionella cardiaca]|uniref:Outer membrane protein transport protein n=1 Tax=Legionella cardiaca TaxID=1071983 RepID=A0ABY8AWZ6_9GAMM|nr:outer membrane protein transport protein [Legionella cardiaca]WED43657.1 outer membrane protein transport protein [Legionella cardiaca]
MRYSVAIFLSLTSVSIHANVLQYYTGITYSNPAELFKVKENEFLIGMTGFFADVRFAGSVLNLNTFQYDSGISASRRFSVLPYGRIASRLNEKLVFGVDVTQPFHSNLIYGLDSFTRYASVETIMTDVDISPRFSFNVAPKLNVGAGLNMNFLKNNETNWALPISQTAYAKFVNRTSGFGVGYNLGAYLMINSSNFLGATYYNSIKQKTRGESFLDSNVSNDLVFNFRMPTTTVVNYVHLFNPKWLVSAQIFCSQWNANQYARIKNTAAPPPLGPDFTFTMKYSAAWAYAAALRKQQTENLGLTLIGLIDDGPERDHLRTLNFPSDVQYFLALSADYHLTKTSTMELLYGHVFSNTTIANSLPLNGQPTPFTTGKVRINADVFELRYKLQT